MRVRTRTFSFAISYRRSSKKKGKAVASANNVERLRADYFVMFFLSFLFMFFVIVFVVMVIIIIIVIVVVMFQNFEKNVKEYLLLDE